MKPGLAWSIQPEAFEGLFALVSSLPRWLNKDTSSAQRRLAPTQVPQTLHLPLREELGGTSRHARPSYKLRVRLSFRAENARTCDGQPPPLKFYSFARRLHESR